MKKKESAVPAVDTNDPGFSFRWKKYDHSIYAHTRSFARLPRSIIGMEINGDMHCGVWSGLRHTSKAVLIVILRHANSDGVSFPSQELICAKSGISTLKTVGKACKELEGAGLIKVNKFTTPLGKRANRYVLTNKLLDNHDYIASYHHHLEAGYWAVMGNNGHISQSLYWAIRFFSRPRADLDSDQADCGWTNYDSDEGREWLANRDGDVCCAERESLCEFAGITTRSYGAAMEILRKMKVITSIPDHPDKLFVNFYFGHHYSSDYLNSILKIA